MWRLVPNVLFFKLFLSNPKKKYNKKSLILIECYGNCSFLNDIIDSIVIFSSYAMPVIPGLSTKKKKGRHVSSLCHKLLLLRDLDLYSQLSAKDDGDYYELKTPSLRKFDNLKILFKNLAKIIKIQIFCHSK